MTARRIKRNTRTSKEGQGFEISRKPVVRLAEHEREHDVEDSLELAHAHGPSVLFAIARDPETIFVYWNIDWPSIFGKTTPADRQVHLRVYCADGSEESSVAVEPMAAMYYVATSRSHDSCRVEIGYYQPADVWHSVAMSNEVKMPPQGNAEIGDVDLATIPFHVSFQKLLDLFGAPNETAIAAVISQFQKRALSSEKFQRLSPEEERILRKLEVSLSEIVASRRAFDDTDSEKLARRTGALPAFGPSSPNRGFADTSWS